jgi:hypothetical protein
VQIASHGNCLVAVVAMLGWTLEKLKEDELEYNDPRYPILVTFLCRKNATPKQQRIAYFSKSRRLLGCTVPWPCIDDLA